MPKRGAESGYRAGAIGSCRAPVRCARAIVSAGNSILGPIEKNDAGTRMRAGGSVEAEGNMRLRLDSQGHARLVESTVKGIAEVSTIGVAVRRSWSRCLSTYSLDPAQIKKPVIVERTELESRCERMGTVLPIARIEMLG